MTEETWGDDFEEPRRSPPAVPRWVWTCGCGCLGAAVLVVLAAITLWDEGVAWMEGHLDPAQQWPQVDEVLPLAGDPPALEIVRVPFAGLMGIDIWYLADHERELHALLLAASGETGDELSRSMFDVDRGRTILDQPIEAGDLEELDVGGRAIRVVRFRQEEPEADADEPRWRPRAGWSEASGAGAILDLSPADESRAVVLQLMRASSEEPLTDGELRTFLEPFEIGE